jgi:hypothetical protein
MIIYPPFHNTSAGARSLFTEDRITDWIIENNNWIAGHMRRMAFRRAHGSVWTAERAA